MRTLPLLVLLAAPAAAGDNLVPNGDFADGRRGWLFMSFSKEATYDIEDGALVVTKAGGAKVDTAFRNFELKPEHAGARLAVSARVRAKRLGSARLVLLLYDGAGEIVVEQELHDKPLKKTFRWKTLKKTVDAPDTAVSGRILLQVMRKGAITLDDIRVAPAGGAPDEKDEAPAGIDGSFDRGWKGWRPFPAGFDGVEAATDARVKKGGAGALRLERGAARFFPTAGLASSAALKRRTRRVTLTVQCRADGALPVLALWVEDKNGVLLASARAEVADAPADAFAARTLVLDVPRGAARAGVALGTLGPGRCWFDDAELEAK